MTKPKRKRRLAAAVAAERPLVVTTFRLYRDQLLALQRQALERLAEGAPGRADASALLRELLDRMLRTGAKRFK